MAKFNSARSGASGGRGPIVSESTASGSTFEGAPGYVREAQSELFLLAVTNMVGEDTCYERAGDRDDRFGALVREVAVRDPAWILGLIRWLRIEAHMRSAALVAAAEAAHALLEAKVPGARQFIAVAPQRADEPGELLAYWTSRYGRGLPKPVKRGIGDAAVRLYTERALLKYDTDSHGYRFADVLELTHPTARDQRQGVLFKHAIDRRHRRDNPIPEELTLLRANAALRTEASGTPEALLDADRLRAAGMTWEDVLSLAGSTMPKRRLWEALIPSMGYMALLRNLRNLDQAGVGDDVAAGVAARLADSEEVARSRQLPMRYLSAYRAAPSLRWAYPLEQALDHCLGNIPTLRGRTLILIDTSGSMDSAFGRDSTLKRWDAAVVFGLALARRCANADVVSFSATVRGRGHYEAKTRVFPMAVGESLLKATERWRSGGWFLGGGTATSAALRAHFAGHDRIVILTDEQATSDAVEVHRSVPQTVPMTTFNLAGYRYGHAPSGGPFRTVIGGLTDAGFRLIPLVESGRVASWPFAV